MKKHVDQLVKSLAKIEEGIAEVKTLVPVLFDGEVSSDTVDEAPKKSTSKTSKKGATKKEVDMNEPKSADTSDCPSREDLDAMKYNDLKKYGSSLGIKCTGTRDEITEKILSALENGVADDEDEKVVPIDKNKKKASSKGKTVKKEEPEEEPEEDDSVSEDSLQTARELLEEYSIEEIVETLADCGIKLTARQKKQQDVVMRKLAEAIAEGLIETDDEEDAEDSEEVVDNSDTEFTADSYFEDYDPEGFNDPESMSKKRKKACEAKVAEILEAYDGGELTADDMEEELQDILNDDEADLLGDDYEEEELLALYIEKKKHFIDDDGEEVEPGEPYELGGSNFCCGHQLKYSKKTNQYICETCGEEYEAE